MWRNACSEISDPLSLTFLFYFLGSIGVAAAAVPTTNATNSTLCQGFFAPYHASVGSFFSALGLLLCTILVWGAVRRSLSDTYKCLYNIIVYTLAILVITPLFVCLLVSFGAGLYFFMYVAVYIFSSITTDHCHDVAYYWAFVETLIVLLLIGLAILFTLFCLTYKIVKCLK